MSDHVYKVIEVVGSSTKSVEDGIENAIARANETIENVEWFKTEEVRGSVMKGKVAYYQVVLKVGFRLN
ncbi:dodecin family protein [Haliea atlantica]|jgi:hypothetical protein|nr:hypothetical protein [Haliea sp.]MAL96329.1 hypothetical protein [Haliea sp.]|tara:strand:+ start:41179 stop:41385 length:207 start_codon:yes stop_codon:yes gene_type:complete